MSYHVEEYELCARCGSGVGREAGVPVCLAEPDWCQANPLPRREDVPRGVFLSGAHDAPADLDAVPDEGEESDGG